MDITLTLAVLCLLAGIACAFYACSAIAVRALRWWDARQGRRQWNERMAARDRAQRVLDQRERFARESYNR
jgi:hypothetical protein